MSKIILTLLPLVLAGCSVESQYEDYMLASPADIVLTQANHPHGYTKTQCYICHNPSNFHQVNRVNAPSFGFANTLVQQSGLASCSGCHGTNGVP